MELTAVYAENVVPQGTSVIESVTPNTSTGKMVFVSVSSVPSDAVLVKAGLIATSDAEVGMSGDGFNDSTAEFVKTGTTTSHSLKYTWTKSKVTSDQTWYVRGYVVYQNSEGVIQTVYGDVTAAKMDGTVETIQ